MPEKFLTSRELAAYQYTLRMHPEWALQDPFAPALQASWYALFLSGTDCPKIAELNHLPLGEICIARVRGGWDIKRAEHVERLLEATNMRLQKVALESVEFLVDQLSVAHKQFGDKLKNYLQSGDKEDLPVFAVSTMDGYQRAHRLLKEIMGEDGGEGSMKEKGGGTAERIDSPPAPHIGGGIGARDLIRGALIAQGKIDADTE